MEFIVLIVCLCCFVMSLVVIALLIKSYKSLQENMSSLEKELVDNREMIMEVITKNESIRNMFAIRSEVKAIKDSFFWTLSDDDFEKIFKPGKIEKIVDKNLNSESIFSYEKNGDIVVKNFENSNLKSLTIHDSNGMPKEGHIFNEAGEEIRFFEYDDLGQVASENKN